MRKPDCTFKINNFTWKLFLVEEIDPNLAPTLTRPQDLDLGAWAVTKVESLSIFLQNEKLDAQLYRSHIIHELVHAYLFSFGYLPEEMDEEGICYFFQHQGENILKQADEVYAKIKDKLIPFEEV